MMRVLKYALILLVVITLFIAGSTACLSLLNEASWLLCLAGGVGLIVLIAILIKAISYVERDVRKWLNK
jgi:hypothetical protein